MKLVANMMKQQHILQLPWRFPRTTSTTPLISGPDNSPKSLRPSPLEVQPAEPKLQDLSRPTDFASWVASAVSRGLQPVRSGGVSGVSRPASSLSSAGDSVPVKHVVGGGVQPLEHVGGAGKTMEHVPCLFFLTWWRSAGGVGIFSC